MKNPIVEPAIIIQNVTKSFKIPLEASSGIKQKLVNTIKGRKGYREFTPLNDISLTINKGDFFGIVGRNGSGKSTLLKTIAGVYTPNGGSVVVDGAIVPFIELGVGFNPELTGRENVFLNGALLGFSRKEIHLMYDDIVDFAELHDFMEERLKNYSSGMQVRLAFSIAIKAQGDILLLDEVLAVGDEAFQRKCFSYFAQLKKQKKTVILVTHSMESVQQFCTKAMLLDKGKILTYGNPAKVAQKYRELNTDKKPKQDIGKSTLHEDLTIKTSFRRQDKNLLFGLEIKSRIDLKDAVITLIIRKESGEWVYRFATDDKLAKNLDIVKDKPLKLELEIDDIFPEGVFLASAAIKSRDRSKEFIAVDDFIQFEVANKKSRYWEPKEKYTLK